MMNQLETCIRQFCECARHTWAKHFVEPVHFALEDITCVRTRAVVPLLSDRDVLAYRVQLDQWCNTVLVFPKSLLLDLTAELINEPPACADRALNLFEESVAVFLLQKLIADLLGRMWQPAVTMTVAAGAGEPAAKIRALFDAEERLYWVRAACRSSFGQHTWQWLVPANLGDGPRASHSEKDHPSTNRAALAHLDVAATLAALLTTASTPAAPTWRVLPRDRAHRCVIPFRSAPVSEVLFRFLSTLRQYPEIRYDRVHQGLARLEAGYFHTPEAVHATVQAMLQQTCS